MKFFLFIFYFFSVGSWLLIGGSLSDRSACPALKDLKERLANRGGLC